MKKNLIYILIILTSFLLKTSISTGNEEKDETKLLTVVIDPGHGGKDPGAVSGLAREKEIVLDLALRLGNKIKLEFPDIKVIYTRKSDVFIPLYERANIANRNKADLFISLHANAVDTKSVQGTETFVLGNHRSKDNLEIAKKENAVILLEDDYSTTYEDFDPNSDESYIMFELVQDEYLEQSVLFASSIQEQLRKNAKRVDRSVKQAGFLVLRRTTMPSVLIEAGFLSNTAERNFLLKDSGKEQITSSIFTAFQNYKRKIEEKSNFNLIIEAPEENTQEPDSRQKSKDKIKKDNVKKPEIVESKNTFFSVQIAASKKNLETKPANFMGETKIFKNLNGDIYRYFSGKFDNYEQALAEKTRLQNKFGGAFVVAFENETLISVKKARGKM